MWELGEDVSEVGDGEMDILIICIAWSHCVLMLGFHSRLGLCRCVGLFHEDILYNKECKRMYSQDF